MPHAIHISGEPAVARVAVDGAIDVSYWRWLLYDSLRQTETAGVTRILFDLRSADLHMDADRLLEVGETVERLLTPRLRLAAIVRADRAASPGWNRLLSPSDDCPVHFFASDEEGLDWLGRDSREAAA